MTIKAQDISQCWFEHSSFRGNKSRQGISVPKQFWVIFFVQIVFFFPFQVQNSNACLQVCSWKHSELCTEVVLELGVSWGGWEVGSGCRGCVDTRCSGHALSCVEANSWTCRRPELRWGALHKGSFSCSGSLLPVAFAFPSCSEHTQKWALGCWQAMDCWHSFPLSWGLEHCKPALNWTVQK